DVAVAGRASDADAAVAPSPERRARERVDVEPVVEVLVGRLGIADAVRSLVAAHRLQRGAAAVGHSDGEPGARLADPTELPTTKDRVHRPRPVAAPLAALAPGQVVGGREHEVVAYVVERGPVVPLRLVRVHPVSALGLHEA